MAQIKLRVHPDARRWRPSSQDLRAMGQGLVQRSVTIRLLPRSKVKADWKKNLDRGKPFPGYYAYRAYTRGTTVTLFVDETETPESILWLLAHELAHVAVNGAPMLHEALRSIPKPRDYLTSDEAHEAYPEEQLANLVADQWMVILGSQPGLDRLWWRKRVRRLRPSGR